MSAANRSRRAVRLTLIASVTVLATGTAGALTGGTGPNSSQSPYLVPVAGGVQAQSILTAGDVVPRLPRGGPYRMVGIPDGAGAFDNGNGTYTLLVNHELPANAGVVREHGTTGAFVSKWMIAKHTNQVIAGEDLIKVVAPVPGGSAPFARFCSGDLPAASAFFNAASGKGTPNRIYMNGEESGAEGRAFGHVVTGPAAGTSYFLPRLGRFSWENSVANPGSGDKTLVLGADDSTPGQVYLYVGDKQTTGSDVDRAGLTNGNLFGIAVTAAPLEDRTGGVNGSTSFSLVGLGDVSGLSGTTLDSLSNSAGVTRFLRPEDVTWEPADPRVAYFVTTDRYDQVKDNVGSQIGRSRLWKLTLNSLTAPTGGSIVLLLDGTEATNMMDNLTADGRGHVILQEDVGGQAHNGKIWQYDLATDSLKLLLRHDPARFGDLNRPPSAPYTNDEESSGIFPAFDILGPGWFLLDVQAHYPTDAETVEGGQLLAIYNPDSAGTPTS